MESTQQHTTTANVQLSGRVHGGQQPVSGAHVYLFAAGNTTYGGSSTSLLVPIPGVTETDSIGSYVTTNPDGSFSLSGDYSCTSGQQLYALATGGSPGLAGGKVNPALSLMAAVGACPANGSAGLAQEVAAINEVTTVATAYALSGFMTDPIHVSSGPSTQSMTGLANAFMNVPTLVDGSSGVALSATSAGNGIAPQAKLNTVANLLAACVNSDGTGPYCSVLFANSRSSSSGLDPLDTATAAVNIAHAQWENTQALFSLQLPSSPFQPNLAAAPTDFTLPVTFSAPGLSATQLAVDANGNIFFVGNNAQIVELQSNGSLASSVPYTPDDSITSYLGVAVEASGNLWVCFGGSSDGPGLAKLSPSFSLLTRYNNTQCKGVSVGLPGNIFASNDSQNYALGIDLPLTGYGVQFTRFTGNGLSSPGAIASSSKGVLAIVSPGGLLSSFLPNDVENGNVAIGSSAGGIAMDAADTAWVVDTADSTIFATTLTVGSLTATSYNSGIASPNSIAIDGNSQAAGIWYTNAQGLIGGSVGGVPITETGFSIGQPGTPVAVGLPDLLHQLAC